MIEWFQIPPPPALAHCRAYQREVLDGHLSVFVGQEADDKGESCWHLSISHRKSGVLDGQGNPAAGRIPTWHEIKEARYRFCPADVNMALMLPPKELYVNSHETTMHLWQIPVKYAE